MTAHPSILLIEDSPGECELFRVALIQTGADVSLHTEFDANAAFRSLTNISGTETRPSLILLGLKLGNQHGLDFLRRLRTDARSVYVPVIVFATSDDPADLAACYAAGTNGSVVKPETYEQLVQCSKDPCRYWLL